MGQSVPIAGRILEHLTRVTTLGRAQWWLVLASGLVWKENECPYIPIWTSHGGGGGPYILETDCSIFDHGYLPANLLEFETQVTYETILGCLEQSAQHFASDPHQDWFLATQKFFVEDQNRIRSRLARFRHWLSMPDLGGVMFEDPLDPET